MSLLLTFYMHCITVSRMDVTSQINRFKGRWQEWKLITWLGDSLLGKEGTDFLKIPSGNLKLSWRYEYSNTEVIPFASSGYKWPVFYTFTEYLLIILTEHNCEVVIHEFHDSSSG